MKYPNRPKMDTGSTTWSEFYIGLPDMPKLMRKSKVQQYIHVGRLVITLAKACGVVEPGCSTPAAARLITEGLRRFL